MKTPAQPPFPALQTFTAEGKLDADGTLTTQVQQTVRGDVEVFYRAAFRSVSPQQWKQLGQQISSSEGFSGEVSEVNASTPEETGEPFQLSYQYTKKKFGDWNNRQILAPVPWFGIESAAVEEKKPEEPVILGALGELVYQSKTTLPAGLAPDYSAKVDLSEDFAEYHASYAIENGIFTANRRLLIKKSEVPLDSWEKYKKFCKALADERNRYVDLNTGATVYPAGEGPAQTTPAPVVASNAADGAVSADQPAKPKTMQEAMIAAARDNPEAAQLMRTAAEAMQRQDLTGAEESLRRVAELYPHYPGVHAALAGVYGSRRDIDGLVREMKTELDNYPEFSASYRTVAQVLLSLHRTAEALEVYRKWVALDPSNRDAALGYSNLLSDDKKYPEAIDVLEKALKLSPDSSSLQSALGTAYLSNRQTEQGVALLAKALKADSSGLAFNDAAYKLADMNVDLDQAKEWGDKALAQAEAESVKADSEQAGLAGALHLGMVWDTVGWIYFRRGEYQQALLYLRAAWLLQPLPDVGDHLGQLYEKLGKKQEAAHLYKLALASSGGGSHTEEIRRHYEQVSGEKSGDIDLPVLRRHDSGPAGSSLEEELSRMRTIQLSPAASTSGSATFSIVFSPGKVDEVKYLSGEESLKPMAAKIAAAKFNVEFPDAGPVRMYRRGVLVCSKLSGCDVALLLPDSLHTSLLSPDNVHTFEVPHSPAPPN
jgi:tetratricopeptide (TPR) repeat protein